MNEMCDPLSVVLVVPTLGIGGAERQAAMTAVELRRRGFSTSVVALATGGPVEALLRDGGVPTFVLGSEAWKRRVGRGTTAHLRGFWAFGRLMRKLAPHIIHAFLPVPNVYSAVAKRLFVPAAQLVVSKRALGLYKAGRPLLAHAERWCNSVADVVLVNSQAVADDVLRRERPDPSKFRLIRNGVDVKAYRPAGRRDATRRALSWRPDERVIGVLSNLFAYKGLEDFIEAAAAVRACVPDARFVIVGRDEGIGANLEALAREHGIAEHVQFLGQRDDVAILLEGFDVLVHPSQQEGFSNAILEGMAAGKPMVVTNAGGNREAIVDGETGIVVPVGDTEAMASGILRLLSNPDEALRLGMAAMQRAQKCFGLKRMVDAIEALYRELVLEQEAQGREGGSAE